MILYFIMAIIFKTSIEMTFDIFFLLFYLFKFLQLIEEKICYLVFT